MRPFKVKLFGSMHAFELYDDNGAARHCGAGIAGLKTRTWDTREEALAAAEELGVEVTR